MVATEKISEFVLEDFYDLLAGLDRLKDVGSLGLHADISDEVLHYTEFDIGFQEREPDFTECIGDILIRDFSNAPEITECFVEVVSEIREHGWDSSDECADCKRGSGRISENRAIDLSHAEGGQNQNSRGR